MAMVSGAGLTASACSLTTDLDRLQSGTTGGSGGASSGGAATGGGGDGGGPPLDCPPGQKACEGTCVSIVDPATGCDAEESCAPCDIPNAVAACLGECVPLACVLGSLDCDLDSPGCETPATDPSNCNECGTECSPFHATPSCTPSGCGVAACEPGFEDCDSDELTGCETNVASDPEHCGDCITNCTTSPGNWTCQPTGCVPSPCSAPFGDCLTPGVCNVDLDATVAHCGFCNNACSFANASAMCSGGDCAIAQCLSTYGNCDTVVENGCETNLNDSPSHCGACNHSCFGGFCDDGVCQPAILAASQQSPVAVAASATHVYWLNQGDLSGLPGTVNRRSLTLGSQPAVLVTGLSDPRGLALDATHVYFTEFQGGRVSRAPLAGGAPTLVATEAGAWDVLLRSGFVYWAGTNKGAILRRATSLMSLSQTIASPGFVWDMDMDDTHVYYTLPLSDQIRRSPVGGGTTELLVSEGAEYVAVYAGWVYYGGYLRPVTLKRVPLTGGPSNPLATGSWYISALAADDSGVYLADAAGGAIVRVPLAGGAPVTIASGQPYPASLWLSGDSVYWTNLDGGTVMRLAK